MTEIIEGLRELPGQVHEILEEVEPIKTFAQQYGFNEDVFFIGRSLDYAVALEGSLKLKEISYIHAEAYAAGELKHGPIALIEDGTPVVAIMPAAGSLLAEKMASNIQEVKARGAVIIAIADSPLASANHLVRIPTTHEFLQPVLSVVPLQVIAYEMAIARGNDVDQPRNLAKSVTVE
jgi:glucosamine--fructose-6-phosphate aminotransferase (isomerizing)